MAMAMPMLEPEEEPEEEPEVEAKSPSLSEFVDQHLYDPGIGFALPFAGPYSQQVHGLVGSEQIATPLISTIFWRAFIETPTFAQLLIQAGASPRAITGDKLVVSHGVNSGLPRYDLVVFDPAFGQERPVVVPRVQVSTKEIIQGWNASIRDWSSGAGMALDPRIVNIGPYTAIEAMNSQPFGLLITSPLEMEPTALIPSPAMKVEPTEGGEALSTVGVVAQRRKDGKIGVTTARHALNWSSNVAVNILVNGFLGTVISEDVISDSCFIEVSGLSTVGMQGTREPLRGLSPRAAEPVTFEGITSGKVVTEVKGWDPFIPFTIDPSLQLRLITDPITARGDSGAALIDSENHVLGFAHLRTSWSAKQQMSTWIWAESVFNAHDLI